MRSCLVWYVFFGLVAVSLAVAAIPMVFDDRTVFAPDGRYYRDSVQTSFQKGENVSTEAFERFGTQVIKRAGLMNGWSKGLSGACEVEVDSIGFIPEWKFYGVDTVILRCENYWKAQKGDPARFERRSLSAEDVIEAIGTFLKEIDASLAGCRKETSSS